MSANLSNDPNITFKRKSFALAFVILVALPPLFIYYKNSSDTKTVNLNRPAAKTWFHRFNKSDADGVHSIVQTKKGYLVLGDTAPSDRNCFVKGMDFDAKELWNKVLQSNVNRTIPMGLELDTTYLVSYRSILGDKRQKASVITGFSVRIDKQTHRIVDRSPKVFKTITPSTKGYIASGEHNKLFSYDKDGLLLWEKSYSHGDFFTGVASGVRYEISRGKILKVMAVEENNFFVLGRARLSGASRGSPWLFKLDSSGEVLWEKTLQNPYAYPSDAIFTKDGGYLVLLSDSNHHQIHLKKYDKNGTLLWSQSYRNQKSLSWHMAQMGDGSYIVTGSTHQKKSVKIMWLLKIDQKGQLLWQKKRRSEIGDFPTAIISTLDGGVLIGGQTTKQGYRVKKMYKGHLLNQFKLLEEGAWLLKLDANGESSDEAFTFESTQEWKEI